MTERTPEEIARAKAFLRSVLGDDPYIRDDGDSFTVDGCVEIKDVLAALDELDRASAAALRAAVEAEREACAKVAEADADVCSEHAGRAFAETTRKCWMAGVDTGKTIAEAIRARGKA